MFKRIIWLSLFLSLSAPTPARPQTSTLPEVVVTASPWEEPGASVTQNLTVITREEIEAKGVPFVAELLASQPGLSLARNGGVGKNATLFLRGGNGRQVLVLIDGVKLNSPTTGAADLSGIATDDIERIEIVKGAQSTLYGSEAMAGVVNIITKEGTDGIKTHLSAEGGSFATRKTSGTLSGGTDRWDYRLSAAYFDTDGISVAKNGNEEDGYENTSVSSRIGFTPSAQSALGLNLRYARDRSALDDYLYGAGPVDDPNWVQKREDYLVSVNGEITPLENYEQALILSLAGEKYRTEDSDTAWNNARIDTSTRLVDWRHTLDLDPVTLTAGYAYRQEDGNIEDSYHETTDNHAGYLNGKLRLFDEALIVDGGIRHDAHETFGDRFTYRAGLLYHLKARGTRLKVNYGTGFRAPSLNELYYPYYGNVDLKPETSTSFDAGIEQDFFAGRLTVSATWFQHRYRNLIQTNFATFTADNIGRARSEGIETEITVKPCDPLTLTANYTYLDAVDLETNRALSLRSRHTAGSTLEYRVAPFAVGVDYHYVGRRYDASAQRYVASYALVDLRVSWDFAKGLTLFGRVNNLLDKDYTEVDGYGTPGIAAYAGLRATF